MALRDRGRAAALLLATTTLAGCAGRPAAVLVAPAPTVDRVDVHALVARGCYHCLERAYEAAIATSGPGRQAPEPFEAASGGAPPFVLRGSRGTP